MGQVRGSEGRLCNGLSLMIPMTSYVNSSGSNKKKAPRVFGALFLAVSSLTMTYFHTGIRTIIGAESFHCPVRDGKEWDQLAMVIRL